jgi:hypothetical protein
MSQEYIYEFVITAYNGRRMMGPYDQYIYTCGLTSPGHPGENVELF